MWSDYWGALTARQRAAVAAGAAAIVAALLCGAWWLLRNPYVPLVGGLVEPEVTRVRQALERAAVSYRIEADGATIGVPSSQLDAARAALATDEGGAPPAAGLELFKEMDFSTTEFAQKINYQRALQGELTRTIQTIAGVRSARVHVILAEGGLFKRSAAKASAAVSVTMQPGQALTQTQVRGIQRLVTASVPQIALEDVVVLDASGASLTRPADDAAGELSSAQLDMKREVDRYLEGKLMRVLDQLVGDGVASLSVDATLDYRQLRVTTEEPLAARGAGDHGRAAGVLVKQRQSQRGRAPAMLPASDYADDYDYDADVPSVDSEYEYKVGHRVEQTLSTPGSIQRVSVAVALRGVPDDLTADAVEEFVAHAVGMNRERGDSVAVIVLPDATVDAPPVASVAPMLERAQAASARPTTSSPPRAWRERAWIVVVAVLAVLAAAVFARLRPSRATPPQTSDADVEAIAAKVRHWLSEGTRNGRP